MAAGKKPKFEAKKPKLKLEGNRNKSSRQKKLHLVFCLEPFYVPGDRPKRPVF